MLLIVWTDQAYVLSRPTIGARGTTSSQLAGAGYPFVPLCCMWHGVLLRKQPSSCGPQPRPLSCVGVCTTGQRSQMIHLLDAMVTRARGGVPIAVPEMAGLSRTVKGAVPITSAGIARPQAVTAEQMHNRHLLACPRKTR